MTQFSVCALFYGQHPELARRWVRGFEAAAQWELIQDVRLGLNAACEETQQILREAAARFAVPTTLCIPEKNIWKYPLMRVMFQRHTPLAPFTIWFDDDSWIHDNQPTWFSYLAKTVQPNCMYGKIYTLRDSYKPAQWRWIQQQPWAKADQLPMIEAQRQSYRSRFITGGFWVIDSKILRTWGWPSRDIQHNGGDYMLGELCRHQKVQLKNFEAGVSINSEDGRPSTAKRRGGSTPHPGSPGLERPAPCNCRIEQYGVTPQEAT